ncbi:hypothetical protein ACDA55_02425 [Rhizobium ruizarguesonis]
MTLSKKDYRRLLEQEFLPDSVIATKPTADSDWVEGNERSALHDYWLLRTEDNTKVLETDFPVAFNTVVGPFGVRLNDQTLLSLLLTKKIMVIRLLSIGIGGSRGTARTCMGKARHFDWLVRSLFSYEMYSLSSATQIWFNELKSQLKNPDILSLIPYEERLRMLIDASHSGRWTFPTHMTKNQRKVDYEQLASAMGVTSKSLNSSTEFREILYEKLGSFVGVGAKHIVGVRPASNVARGIQKSSAKKKSRSIRNTLEVLGLLVILSGEGSIAHDPLSFDPFQEVDIDKMVDGLGAPGGRTATLDPADLFRIMDVSAKWIIDYADYILDAWDIFSDDPSFRRDNHPIARANLTPAIDAKRPEGAPYILMAWAGLPAKKGGGRLNLAAAIRYLLASCAALTIALTVRRYGEVVSSKLDCLFKDANGVLMYSTYIEKTWRDLDAVPVPESMRRVVAVVKRISERTRVKTGEEWLYRVLVSDKEGVTHRVSIKFATTINEYLNAIGLKPPLGQDVWDIAPHVLRRGPVVSYYHGLKGASLDGVSRVLLHFDPGQSRIYVNYSIPGAMARLRDMLQARIGSTRQVRVEERDDFVKEAYKLLSDLKAREEAFNEVRCEAFVASLMDIWTGKESLIGNGAVALVDDFEAMKEAAATQIRLGSRTNSEGAFAEALIGEFKKYVKSHYLDPLPGGRLHCTCRKGVEADLQQALCLKTKWAGYPETADQDIIADFAFTNDYVCLTCPFGAALKQGQKLLSADVKELKAVASKFDSGSALGGGSREKYLRMKAAVAAARKAVTNAR